MFKIPTFIATAIIAAFSGFTYAGDPGASQAKTESARPAVTKPESTGSSFAVDIPGLIEASVSKVLEAHDELEYDDFVMEQEDIYFHCDSEARWRYVDGFTLELPNQAGPASLCEVQLKLIIKDTLEQNRMRADGASEYCYDAIDFESISVIVYGSGVIETHRGQGHSGGTISCDKRRIFLSIDEAIAQYVSAEIPDQDPP
ncbi:hypothetical protein [Microbulbifer sp. YPW1]|uniref:hypothetical protein n=1 Tax=Microbulbifer sp. YPW1 TaxID=2745199 RepID=UPI0015984073|nr:hypothetical protein [Microbulbifer sp. YPW1]QKX18399.1 hypothetical protein HUW35_16310 [Microbulbifer sp. YPW1]